MEATYIIILTLCVSVTSAALSNGFSCNSKMKADWVELIVDRHNSWRALIAYGMQRNQTGKLPPAKNMYELSWDCELEKKAELIATNGDYNLESIQHHSANVDHRSHCPNFEVDYHYVFAKSLQRWWFEITEFGQTNPENLYNDDSLEHFANMAHGSNTKLGCSYHRKGRGVKFVCVYDIAPQWNKPIYELGTRCQKDADCTTYKGSKCDDLCVKK